MERPLLGGRYELGPAIGAGGFGTVFRARDRWSGADVAVKLVLPGLGSEAAAQRLRRESQFLRRVISRNVARVYDAGDDADGVWLVTELVEGGPLQIASLGRPLLPHEVLRVARGLLEGLAAVHGAGLVHGDVKPSNVLVPLRDRNLSGVKLVDFGLARMMARREVSAAVGEALDDSTLVLGTPRWMAPEVLLGGPPTARSDLYAAGLVLFDLLDEGPLFPVGDLRAQLRARIGGDPILDERVPEPLDDVFARLLARDPERRYPDAAAAHEAVVDLDTAPVSTTLEDTVVGPAPRASAAPPSLLASGAPSGSVVPIEHRSTAPPLRTASPPSGPPPPRTLSPSVGPARVAAAAVVTSAPARLSPSVPPSSRTSPSVPPSSRSAPASLSEAPRPDASPKASRHPEPAPSAPAVPPPGMPPRISVLPEPIRPAPSLHPPLAGSWEASPEPALVARLTSLPTDGIVALRETLRHLDLPMLDALARRERGNLVGRIARALALALRLELDAAALIVEPLAMQSDVSRAIGAAILAPRARRVTRARADSDRDDTWVETLDAELAGMLAALAAALGAREDAPRDQARCARALGRLESLRDPATDATRDLVRAAHAAVLVRTGEIDRRAALDIVVPAAAEARPELPFHRVVRALSATALVGDGDPVDAGRIGPALAHAERIAAETGTTLLDATAATALGALLVDIAPHDDHGLRALERAGTLLAHGDAPMLEHRAEHHLALALLALGQWRDAVPHLRRAREAAHAERAGDFELLSAAIESIVELAIGDKAAAEEAAAVLSDARLAQGPRRAAAFGWTARCFGALLGSDYEGAEDALREAETIVRERSRETPDVYVVVEVTGTLFDVVRGAIADVAAAASRLERFASETRFRAFYWLEVLAAVIELVPDDKTKTAMKRALDVLTASLGPGSRLAHLARAEAPPESSRGAS